MEIHWRLKSKLRTCRCSFTQYFTAASLLPIAGADLVLGATWLKTLGHNIVDYDAISVKCIVNDHFVTLQREKPSTPSHASYHHIKRLSKSNAIQEIFTLQLHQLDTITDNWLDLPENMD